MIPKEEKIKSNKKKKRYSTSIYYMVALRTRNENNLNLFEQAV